MPDDTSLKAHTPTLPYAQAALQQRILEHLGVKKDARDLMAPLPYESKYPFSPKTMDALLALSIDPITKPLSLKGELDRVPILRKLANKFADTGYLRRYPGGGIGIGGGGGSDGVGPGSDAAGPGLGPSAEGTAIGGPTALGPPGTMSGSPTGLAGPGDTGFTIGDIGTQGTPEGLGPASGIGPTAAEAMGPGLNTMSVLATLLGFVPGGQIGGLALTAATLGLRGAMALGAFSGPASAMTAAPAIGQGGAGTAGGGQSGGDLMPGMMTPVAAGGGGAGSAPKPAGIAISPTTRANAAARAGGGISPAFLEALERIQAAS